MVHLSNKCIFRFVMTGMALVLKMMGSYGALNQSEDELDPMGVNSTGAGAGVGGEESTPPDSYQPSRFID